MDLPRGGGLEIACDNISIFPASPPGQRYNKSVLRVAAGYKMPVSTHPQAGRTLLTAYLPILSSHNAGMLQLGRILTMVVVAVTFGDR